MLETMRNAAKTWVAKLLMGLLVLSFSVWGITDIFSGVVKGFFAKDLVTINGAAISGAEYTRALQRTLKLSAQQTGQAVTIEDAHKLGIDKQVLDSLIANAAIDGQRAHLGLAVSNNAIAESIITNKAFFDSAGKFDATIYHRLLQQNGLTEEGFVAQERSGRLHAAVTDVATQGAALPKTFESALTQFAGEARDARYFSVTATEADVTPPTDEDLKKQYDANTGTYTAPEYRAVAVMKVDPSDIASKVSVTPEEVQAGYDKYKADYSTPEKRTIVQLTFPTLEAAQKAKARIVAGEDMMKIATEIGAKEADITLKDRRLGDFLDKKIGDAGFALKAGEVSDPISGSLATALLKATQITAAKQSTLDEVKPAITQRLQLEKAKDEIQSIYAAVEDARAQQTKFEKIAERAGIPFQLVPAVSASGMDKDGKDVVMPSKPEILKVAYSSDVGVENDALSVGDGYVWYEVREVIPSALKPLASVKDQVKKDFIAGKLRDAVGDKAKKLVERAAGGAKLEALAAEASAAIKTASNIKRNETSQDFDGAAVTALFGVADQGFAWSLEGDGKTARVMQVSKDTLPAVMATSPEIKKLKDQAGKGFALDVGQGFIASLRQNANVAINEDLWRQNTGGAATP